MRRDLASDGLMECAECKSRLPHGWFAVVGEYADGAQRRSSWCRLCRQGHSAMMAARRRAAGVPRWTDRREVGRLYRLQAGRCKRCGGVLRRDARGRALFHLDHIRAIARGGLHTSANLQILCMRCNLQKAAK